MPKIKELADVLGVSAQSIRNFVKSEFGIVSQERKPIILDANQAAIVADHFKSDLPVVQNTAKEPAKVANSDISVEIQIENAILKERVAGLERDIQRLEEQIKDLKERIAAADVALERQQNISGGFWNRLGRKLLGEGKKQPNNEKPPAVTYEE